MVFSSNYRGFDVGRLQNGVQMNENRNIDIFKQLSKFSVIQKASSLRDNLSCN